MTAHDEKNDRNDNVGNDALSTSGKLRRARHSRRGRILRWCLAAGFVVFLAWLAAWLGQRSLATPARKRAMQSWLDENLNADVSLLGGMTVRLNLARDSRLVLYNTDVEHPNPVFPGRFARIGSMGAWASPFAMAGIAPGMLDIRIQGLDLAIEQAENGEWSHGGLMRPLASGGTPFPFPLPRISNWKAAIESGTFSLRRRGYELRLGLAGEVEGRPGDDRIAARAPHLKYTFGRAAASESDSGSDSGSASGSVPVPPAPLHAGTVDAVNMTFRQGQPGDVPVPVPGRAEARAADLPLSILPFFVPGIPMDEAPGVFNGLIRYDEHPGAAGALFMDGTLNDAPLAVLGLPRNAPFRLTWPIAPKVDGLQASVHTGPSGFGAFTMTVSLDDKGAARLLSMRGDVAALDDVPAFFTRYSHWPDWLSRAFPRLVWRTGRWRGFGWEGSDLAVELTRSLTGLALNGEAEMFGGNIRLSMTPDQPDAPITIAAERLDAAQLAARLSQSLPAPFRAAVSGSGVTLTWRGFPSPNGSFDDWGAGLVWAKPRIDLAASGAFWRNMTGAALHIADALPEWGGGSITELLDVAADDAIQLDQLSIVPEHYPDGSMLIEFRGYGASFGQVTGMIERLRDGSVAGEFLLAGMSRLLAAVRRANPDFATALEFLANDAAGLRVGFVMRPDGEIDFTRHFLDDAKRVHAELRGAQPASLPAPVPADGGTP